MTVPGGELSEPSRAAGTATSPPAEELSDHRFGRPASNGLPNRPAIDELCPYLTAASGSWRSATPHREHRCGGVDPPALLSTEKQRRLCLSVDHGACPTFWAARSSRAQMLAPGTDASFVAAADAARRPIARSSVVILEHPRISMPHARWPLDRALSQTALVFLMIAAFGAVAVARLSAPEAGAPAPSVLASASPTIRPTPTPTRRPKPSPSPLPSPSASGPVSESPAASVAGVVSVEPSFRTTYRVQKGDTLSGIAGRFDTTTIAIRRLNDLASADLKIGQVLKIP